MARLKIPTGTKEQIEKKLTAIHSKAEEKIDKVKAFLQEKALHNVQAMQRDAEVAEEVIDRFTIRKYLVGLAGYNQKQSVEHSGKIEVTGLEMDI